MSDLQKARDEIGAIDREMAALFARRMEAAKEIGSYKRAHCLPVLDADREKELIAANVAYISDPAVQTYYIRFLKNTMQLSRMYQSMLMEGICVGYCGVEGAFAEIASKRIFPDGRLRAHASFPSAYESVLSGACECCVLPIENSTAGDVGQVMDLMFSGELFVNGVYNLPIRQTLIGQSGATPQSIKTVISHPQALSQCTEYIESHGYTCVSAVNTAIAAKQVAESGDPSCAAIASEDTAKLYGLTVIDHDINEAGDNTTRFAVLSPTRNVTGKDGSILFFTVRNEAGALAEAIKIIGHYGFNMRSLRSRPMRNLAWQYYFFVEFDGNVYSEGGRTMCRELSSYCDCLKVAGTFNEYDL